MTEKPRNIADSNFARYRIDKFKSTKARQVPYEKLDYQIYKASSNVVAFTTSEERIIMWTKAIFWRYHVGLNRQPIQHQVVVGRTGEHQ